MELKRTYDRVMYLLQTKPETRNDDKHLIWYYWWRFDEIVRLTVIHSAGEPFSGGTTQGPSIIESKDFLEKATSPESITRARRKVQEQHPELQAVKEVKEARENRERDHRIQYGKQGTFL